MKIIYLVQNHFTSRDYYRYGIEELISSSRKKVEVWDISKLIYPNIKFNYQEFNDVKVDSFFNLIRFKSKSEFKLYVKKSNVLYCFVLAVFNINSLFFFKTLSKNKIYCVSSGYGMIDIQPSFNYYLINNKSLLKKLFNLTIRRFLSFFKNCFYYFLIMYHRINYYNIYFISGGNKTDADNILISNKTKKVRLHSNNFDFHLKKKNNIKRYIKKQYDVYLDQNITFSSDSKLRNDKVIISAKKYYRELNNFFDKLEKITNREIVISAHPKSNINQLKSYIKNRKILTNINSLDLVYHSTNVIVSYSMAIGFAVLYDKNLILITNNDINDYKKPIINSLSKYLKIKYINISNSYRLKNKSNNKSEYSKYINDFITPSLQIDEFFSISVYNHVKYFI